MTYCLAIRVDEGLVFASDSRINGQIHGDGPGIEDDEYLLGLRRAWAENIRTAFESLPSTPLALEEAGPVQAPRPVG